MGFWTLDRLCYFWLNHQCGGIEQGVCGLWCETLSGHATLGWTILFWGCVVVASWTAPSKLIFDFWFFLIFDFHERIGMEPSTSTMEVSKRVWGLRCETLRGLCNFWLNHPFFDEWWSRKGVYGLCVRLCEDHVTFSWTILFGLSGWQLNCTIRTYVFACTFSMDQADHNVIGDLLERSVSRGWLRTYGADGRTVVSTVVTTVVERRAMSDQRWHKMMSDCISWGCTYQSLYIYHGW